MSLRLTKARTDKKLRKARTARKVAKIHTHTHTTTHKLKCGNTNTQNTSALIHQQTPERKRV